MTHEQQAEALFQEWEHSGFKIYNKDATIDFAAFCLEKREKERAKEIGRNCPYCGERCQECGHKKD